MNPYQDLWNNVDFIKVKHSLATLDSANKIVENSAAFYTKKEVVDGYEFQVYSYRLVSYKDFKLFEDDGSLEMRGIVFAPDGTRFLSLHKFFNLYENPYTQFSINNDEDVYVIDKVDGSLIHPIIYNNKLFVKSSSSFGAEQAIFAKKFIEQNEVYENFIRDCYADNKVPFFEYVSPKNQIVVPYENEQLILLAVRDLKTGAYMHFKSLKDLIEQKYPSIQTVSFYKYKFKDVLDKIYNDKGYEGFILYYNNNLVKVKTKWYLSLHTLVSEIREDVLFNMILENRIDDVLCCVEGEKKKTIEDIVEKITDKMNEKFKEARNLYKEFESLNFDKKTFALKYAKNPLFSCIIEAKNFDDIDKNVKHMLKKKYNTYTRVLNFLND